MPAAEPTFPIPSLTVLLTTHDRPAFLRSALRSVRLQTARGRIGEVLVSDNGPLRAAAAVVREFPELPIRYVEAPTDTDFCTHVHRALSLVSTPLLAVLHDDDWWHPGHLQASLAALENHPDASIVVSGNLWLAEETSTAPPLYFNPELLHHFAGGNGIDPMVFDWRQVLMLAWILTPFHLSTMVGHTKAMRAADEVWIDRNYLVDRLYFAALARNTRRPIVYLPCPSALIRVHPSRVTNDLAGEIQRKGALSTVAQLRAMAESEQLDLNALWREAIPRLPSQTAIQLATHAGECLPPEDLAAMGCPAPGRDSPWLPPATHALLHARAAAQFEEVRARFTQDLARERNAELATAAALEQWVQRDTEVAEVFKATAIEASERVDALRRSWATRLLARKLTHADLPRLLRQAENELAQQRAAEACRLYLEATRLGVDTLKRLREAPLLRGFVRGERVRALEAALKAQERCWKSLERLNRKNPARARRGAFGLSHPHYEAQAGRKFFDGREAAKHYAASGWRDGLNPHPLFDTRHFLTRNPAEAVGDQNPLDVYRRLLDRGLAPDAHPRFAGEWLRRYFVETSGKDLRRGETALRETPQRCEEAESFARRRPRIGVGVILFQTTDADLQHLLRSITAAAARAIEAGHAAPVLVLTDNSHQWTAERVAALAEGCGVPVAFHPTESNVGFGRGHNHLMERLFADAEMTHYFCLNPDGMLHPDALAHLYAAIARHGLPALIEARQFPSEHPKHYDFKTHETDWCSAGCLIIPRFLFELTGGFDDHFFMYCEDVDLSWRVWELGYRCLVAPSALFYHRVAGRPHNPRAERWTLESGRILAQRWQAPRFRLECERSLVEHRHYRDSADLPPVPAIPEHRPHTRVDFSHHFTFARARWHLP